MRTNRYSLLREQLISNSFDYLNNDQIRMMMLMVVEATSNRKDDIIKAALGLGIDNVEKLLRELIQFAVVIEVWAIFHDGKQVNVWEDSESLTGVRVKALRNTVFIQSKNRPHIERQLWLSKEAQKDLSKRMVMK